MSTVKCPICGQEPVRIEAKEDSGETQIIRTCLCISGRGATQEESDKAWAQAVDGFLSLVDNRTPGKLVRPEKEKKIIIPPY